MATVDEKDVFSSDHVEQAQHLDTAKLKDIHRNGLEGEMDQAAQILAAAGGQVNYTAQERKRLLRRIDFYV